LAASLAAAWLSGTAFSPENDIGRMFSRATARACPDRGPAFFCRMVQDGSSERNSPNRPESFIMKIWK